MGWMVRCVYSSLETAPKTSATRSSCGSQMIAPTSTARAVDLWEIFVDATNPMVTDLTIGGSDILELINNLINAQDQFASFAGEAFSADLSFAGLADVINITFDGVDEITPVPHLFW